MSCAETVGVVKLDTTCWSQRRNRSWRKGLKEAEATLLLPPKNAKGHQTIYDHIECEIKRARETKSILFSLKNHVFRVWRELVLTWASRSPWGVGKGTGCDPGSGSCHTCKLFQCKAMSEDVSSTRENNTLVKWREKCKVGETTRTKYKPTRICAAKRGKDPANAQCRAHISIGIDDVSRKDSARRATLQWEYTRWTTSDTVENGGDRWWEEN